MTSHVPFQGTGGLPLQFNSTHNCQHVHKHPFIFDSPLLQLCLPECKLTSATLEHFSTSLFRFTLGVSLWIVLEMLQGYLQRSVLSPSTTEVFMSSLSQFGLSFYEFVPVTLLELSNFWDPSVTLSSSSAILVLSVQGNNPEGGRV